MNTYVSIGAPGDRNEQEDEVQKMRKARLWEEKAMKQEKREIVHEETLTEDN